MDKINFANLGDLLNKILDNPSDFYYKISDELTPEERLFIIANLKNKSCGTCTNGCCRVESYEKIGLDEFGRPQGSECIGWRNDIIVGKSKVLKINDIYKLKGV